MITFDPNSFIFAPIRTVYVFHLTLTEKFARETLRLTELEAQFLEPRIAIGKRWPSVSIIVEDWRSHLVLNVKEGDPYSLAEIWEGKQPTKHGSSGWAYERLDRQQTVYAHNFHGDGELDLWRRYLSDAGEEYISLDVVKWWTIRLCALDGRFGQSWSPDRLEPKDENTFLGVQLTERALRPYAFSEPEDGYDDTGWQRTYRHDESNGLSWHLRVIDLQKYLESQSS